VDRIEVARRARVLDDLRAGQVLDQDLLARRADRERRAVDLRVPCHRLALHRLARHDADADRGRDELAALVAVLGDRLAEAHRAAAFALLLPALAGPRRRAQAHARPHRLVVDEALLAVQHAREVAASAAAPGRARLRRLAARRLRRGPRLRR